MTGFSQESGEEPLLWPGAEVLSVLAGSSYTVLLTHILKALPGLTS